MGDSCSKLWGERGGCTQFVGKPEGKRPLERHRSRWQVNIKIDLRETEMGVWTKFALLMIETRGGPLLTR
jgi:hypothetical protein